MDITADPFFPPIVMVISAVFGVLLMAIRWKQRIDDCTIPSKRRAYLLAAIGCLFGVGEGLNRMGFNPAGLSAYLTWAAFSPMCATLIYFSGVSFAKFAFSLHQSILSLLKNTLRIVTLCKTVVAVCFAYVLLSELFDWISVGFDGFIVIAAIVGSTFSFVMLDMMHFDDWNEYAMTELEGGSS